MRDQRFGIEIEMTGITRATAARVIAGHFNTTATHVGGSYDAYTVRGPDGRSWNLVRDQSIDRRNSRGTQVLNEAVQKSAGKFYENAVNTHVQQLRVRVPTAGAEDDEELDEDEELNEEDIDYEEGLDMGGMQL